MRQWGTERFGTMSAFASALGMKPPSLNDYLVGKTLPGNSLQAKLRALGCDIEWLMTGKSSGDLKKEREKKADAVIAFHAPGAMSEEQQKAIQKMVDELAQLPAGEVERAREIIRAAFKKK